MTFNDDQAAAFQREGEITFPESTEEETSADSQSENDNQSGKTQSAEGANTQTDKELPFHEHPRWKQREDEWNSRFNDQEKRHQDDLKTIRDEFGQKRDTNAAQTKIPAWFGGSQEQWDAYREDRDAELKQAEERATARAREDLKKEQSSETKAVEDATAYMRSEMASIESDTTLNPTGAKIDQATAEKLLQAVIENELIDSKGRWNYRAGWKIMQREAPAPKVVDTTEKKKIAGATTSKGEAEKAPKNYATSNDFKGSNRPW